MTGNKHAHPGRLEDFGSLSPARRSRDIPRLTQPEARRPASSLPRSRCGPSP
jgi:hypothetical protein